jgi:DNA-binding IclR family transcriptional regulator
MAPESRVKATQTTFEIIQSLVDLGSAGVSELAQEVGMPKSTVHDHLQTLRELGYVVRDENRGYRVSTKILFIGESIREQMEIYQQARPKLVSLAEETGEYVSLMIKEGTRGVLLFTTHGKKATQLSINPIRPGTETELHTTAPGKAILAHLSPEERRHVIQQGELVSLTRATITDEEELLTALETIRGQGYAVDDEERIVGMRGIGVPILDRDSTVAGAISLYGPTRRMDGSYFDGELPQLATETANVIEVNLNYS